MDNRDKYKRNCFFFEFERGMGASTYNCTYSNSELSLLGNCQCDNCKYFITEKDASDVIREYVSDRNIMPYVIKGTDYGR